MSNFILAGLFTEGTTDVRFLSSVVERTLEDIAFDCTGDIETKLEFYKKSTLQSVENFLNNYDKNYNIEDYIADRNIAKTEFLKNLYGDFYTVIEKKSYIKVK